MLAVRIDISICYQGDCIVSVFLFGIYDPLPRHRDHVVKLSIFRMESTFSFYCLFEQDPWPPPCFSWGADVFATLGNESPWKVQELRGTSGDTSSSQAAATIRGWIDECEQTHELCGTTDQPKSIPKRILELSNHRVRLREDTDSLPRYACLSHCWGPDGPALKLTSTILDTLMSGVPIDELPRTFQDAVKLCLGIHIQYLWIDALCTSNCYGQ